ncbi:3-dehydroquinate synthase [Macrococcus equipercicus]|uniref:3-dehydroquinate synthase n=2 Tax=Macrococcus equipercicus TaxID=69967 RepID=A0ABQ6RA83_9STAP|nr:3-dehydroquinate synthase [Macrococcus equipercicus]
MQLMTTYADNNYPIIVGDEALSSLAAVSGYSHYIYIIDRAVMRHHRAMIDSLIHKHALVYEVDGGEALKTLTKYAAAIEDILAAGITRRAVVIAIGGGSVGDFAGFVAATLLRGVDFIQVPTTILAHDSSVGGKTGLNSAAGKNLIGAFKRPAGVYYDLTFLTSLPYDEKLSGFAEVIKHAMLESEERRRELQRDIPSWNELAALNRMDYWVMSGIRQKLAIVLADELEHGARRYLNLGHTFGHAVEFRHKIPHGYAVMIGLLYMEILSGRTPHHLIDWFRALQLPIPRFADFQDYYELMKKDKKNNDENVQFVLLNPQPCMHSFGEDELKEAFTQLQSLLGVEDEY